MRAATALAEPFRGAGQVAPELALALDPRLGLASLFVLVLPFDLHEVRPHRVFRARHRAVIGTQKAAQNRLKRGERRRQLTSLSATVIVATSPDGTKRFFHCFLLFFSKFIKQCIKQRFIQDHLLFLTALQYRGY